MVGTALEAIYGGMLPPSTRLGCSRGQLVLYWTVGGAVDVIPYVLVSVDYSKNEGIKGIQPAYENCEYWKTDKENIDVICERARELASQPT